MGLLRQIQEITDNMTARTRREVEANNKKAHEQQYKRLIDKKIDKIFESQTSIFERYERASENINTIVVDMLKYATLYDLKNDVQKAYFDNLATREKIYHKTQKAKQTKTKKDIEIELMQTIKKLKNEYTLSDIFKTLGSFDYVKNFEIASDFDISDYFSILNKVKSYYKYEIQTETEQEQKMKQLEKIKEQYKKEKSKKLIKNIAIDVSVITFLNKTYKKTHYERGRR